MKIQSDEILGNQYKTSSNLDSRIAIHERYSTNQEDWHHWLFNQLDLANKAEILECGCGTGALWQKNKSRVNDSWVMMLTDLSDGMLKDAQRNLKDLNNISFQTADIQALSFENDTFDVVFANHMLYHVPNRSKAFEGIKRVLKPNGTFYASTNGIHHMWELKSFLHEFDPDLPWISQDFVNRFSLQHGEEQLKDYFSDISLVTFDCNLLISETDDLINYYYSVSPDLKSRLVKRASEFKQFLETKKSGGAIHVTKEAGVFIAKV